MKAYYEDSAVTIYHGDCRDILPLIEADLILTDPPYLEGDFSWLLEVASRPLVVTPGKVKAFDWIAKEKPSWQYAWRCDGSRSLGGSACLHIGFEPVLAYGMPLMPLGTDVLAYPLVTYYDHNGSPSKEHPWPKPQKLFSKLVAHWTRDGEIVCDPFNGTGTTLRAAKDLGRKAIGIEIEERYCEIAARRMEQEVLALTTSDNVDVAEEMALAI